MNEEQVIAAVSNVGHILTAYNGGGRFSFVGPKRSIG